MAHGRAEPGSGALLSRWIPQKWLLPLTRNWAAQGVLLRRLRPAALLARPAHQGRQRGPPGPPTKGRSRHAAFADGAAVAPCWS